MNMPDAATKAPAARYSVEQRIGVLEELLSERYSVPRLPAASRCRARPSSVF